MCVMHYSPAPVFPLRMGGREPPLACIFPIGQWWPMGVSMYYIYKPWDKEPRGRCPRLLRLVTSRVGDVLNKRMLIPRVGGCVALFGDTGNWGRVATKSNVIRESAKSKLYNNIVPLCLNISACFCYFICLPFGYSVFLGLRRVTPRVYTYICLKILCHRVWFKHDGTIQNLKKAAKTCTYIFACFCSF